MTFPSVLTYVLVLAFFLNARKSYFSAIFYGSRNANPNFIKVDLRSKKKKKKTGNRNRNPDSSRTEGSEHLAPALGWDGHPGEAGLSWRAPRERAPLAGPPPPRGTPGIRAARCDPGSHAAPRPTPRDSPQRAAAPPGAVRRPSAAPPGPPRPTPRDSL